MCVQSSHRPFEPHFSYEGKKGETFSLVVEVNLEKREGSWFRYKLEEGWMETELDITEISSSPGQTTESLEDVIKAAHSNKNKLG